MLFNLYLYILYIYFRYYHLFTGEDLEVDEERDPWPEDCAPLYMSPHEVRPSPWSYSTSNEPRSRVINFSVMPSYQPVTPQSRVRFCFLSLKILKINLLSIILYFIQVFFLFFIIMIFI